MLPRLLWIATADHAGSKSSRWTLLAEDVGLAHENLEQRRRAGIELAPRQRPIRPWQTLA
jgi:hypothetical protein